MGMQLYTWAIAAIVNFYKEFGRYALSCIDYTFLSKV